MCAVCSYTLRHDVLIPHNVMLDRNYGMLSMHSSELGVWSPHTNRGTYMHTYVCTVNSYLGVCGVAC